MAHYHVTHASYAGMVWRLTTAPIPLAAAKDTMRRLAQAHRAAGRTVIVRRPGREFEILDADDARMASSAAGILWLERAEE